MYKVVFTKEGMEVKKEIKKTLSEGVEWLSIERFGWDNLPRKDIEIKVIGIEYELSSNGQKNISKLELTAEYIRKVKGESQIKNTNDDFWTEIEEKLKIKNKNGEILLNYEKTAVENLVDFVKYLFEHNYISKEDLPVPSGHKRYLLNIQPIHKNDANKMKNPKKIDDGVWLEANYDPPNIKKIIKKLGKQFGEKTL
ncbi:MAG: hypothetical protein GXO65_01680 [Euryarchaeota archaeon]|nr:hypothetical protein [Euryarchaeota archaeon]